MRREFLVLPALLLLAGCGSTPERAEPPATTAVMPSTAPVSPQPMAVTVFQVEDGRLHATVAHVPRTRAVAAAALGALGVDAPVAIADGTATVDLAKASDAQVAEIVYTLTQFASIQRVDVAGRAGLTRDDVAAYVAPILVETPADGADVPRTFHVSGTASVFEATLVVQLVRDGATLSKQTVTASEGAPGRGTFDATVEATPGPLEVQVFAPSAADGSPQHEVRVDVTVAG